MKKLKLSFSRFVANLGTNLGMMLSLSPRRESDAIRRIRERRYSLRHRSDWNKVRDDWQAVGGDIRIVMKRAGIE